RKPLQAEMHARSGSAEKQERRWRRLFLRGSEIAPLRQNLTVRRRGRPSESEAVANGRNQVVVREERRSHAGLSRALGKSALRNRRNKSLSHRMRRRKL